MRELDGQHSTAVEAYRHHTPEQVRKRKDHKSLHKAPVPAHSTLEQVVENNPVASEVANTLEEEHGTGNNTPEAAHTLVLDR